MLLSGKIHCGRCHGGSMVRTVRANKAMGPGTLSAIYACDNPFCDRATATLLMFQHSKDRYINRKGDLVGSVSNISKSELDKYYYPPKERP